MTESRGYSLLELLIVMAMIFSIAAIMIPTYQVAMKRAHIGAMAGEARTIYGAFKQFAVDQNGYPNSSTSPAFDLASFEPLVSEGYYDGRVSDRLLNLQADGYDSPDDEGENQEFWLEMTLSYDSSIRFLIADSDNSLLGAGTRYDGVFMFYNGVLMPIGPVD